MHSNKTFFGEFRRSAYRASAVLKVQGVGKGGGRELLLNGVPSCLFACREKNVSEE